METQTRVSRHNNFISVENITILCLSVSLSLSLSLCGVVNIYAGNFVTYHTDTHIYIYSQNSTFEERCVVHFYSIYSVSVKFLTRISFIFFHFFWFVFVSCAKFIEF